MLDRPTGENREDIRAQEPELVPHPRRTFGDGGADRVSFDPMASTDRYRLVVPYAPDPRELTRGAASASAAAAPV